MADTSQTQSQSRAAPNPHQFPFALSNTHPQQRAIRLKNNRAEMMKALRLAATSALPYLSYNLIFNTSTGQVPLGQVFRYWHRKYKDHAVNWVLSQPITAKEEAANVTIDWSASGVTSQYIPALLTTEQDLLSIHLSGSAYYYCTDYFNSQRVLFDSEPEYHMNTVHGTFCARIGRTISHALRADSTCYGSAEEACSLVPRLLQCVHPMALAQIMASLIELSVQITGHRSAELHAHVKSYLQGFLELIVRDLAQYSRIDRPTSHPLVVIFSHVICHQHSTEVLGQTIKRMADAAIQAFGDTQDWKALYIQERLCDSLWHIGAREECHKIRVDLLRRQELFYGKTRRNVLYTLTKVAGDHVWQNELWRAKSLFQKAYDNANAYLQGFDRAKIQFAALEGLTRCDLLSDGIDLRQNGHEIRAAVEKVISSGDITWMERRFGLFCEAELGLSKMVEIATEWFSEDNHRRARAQRIKEVLSRASNNIVHQIDLCRASISE